MGAMQAFLLYLSISHTDMSHWVAKMHRKSRAQTALLQTKAQFPVDFEDHLRRGPCALCL